MTDNGLKKVGPQTGGARTRYKMLGYFGASESKQRPGSLNCSEGRTEEGCGLLG